MGGGDGDKNAEVLHYFPNTYFKYIHLSLNQAFPLE